MFAIRPIRLCVLIAMLATLAACASDSTDEIKVDTKVDTPDAAANGKALFAASCATCHGVSRQDNSMTMVGPNLFGVVGRKAGSVKSLVGGSEGLQKYGVIWSAATLDEFLSNPDAKVPGTAMIGRLTDPQQRADMIAYLSTLKK